MMTRLCERPACSEPGAIAYGFDADRLLVWLTPIDPAADRNRAGVLCLRHADAMVVPIGWSLDDARDPTPRLFSAPARQPRRNTTRKGSPRKSRSTRAAADAVAAPPDAQLALDEPPKAEGRPAAPLEPTTLPDQAPPSEQEQTVAEVTGVSAAAADDPDATVAIPWKPDFDEADDLGGLLDATSPLLARAFTGRRVRRGSNGSDRPR